jgi:putative ABC transport system permease protein
VEERGREIRGSEAWFRLLVRLYPIDFRDEMGEDLVSTYVERARAARRRGRSALVGVWLRALVDSIRNGVGERLHPAAPWRRAGNWGRDAELVLRRLARAPVFTLAVAGTLTVGLAAFAVVYTVVHQVLIAPLPYERPGDLYYVWRDYRAFFDLDRGWTAGTDVVELAEAGGVIEDAVGLRQGAGTLTGVSGERPAEIGLMITTPNLFEVLGVRPALGRGFLPGDAGEGEGRVIILTHALWDRLGMSRSIVGSELHLNGEPYTVVGVMPKGFEFAGHSSLGAPESKEAYIPFDYDLATTSPGQGSYAALIRARAGTSEPVVETAVRAVGHAIDERDFQGRGLELYPVSLSEDLVAG